MSKLTGCFHGRRLWIRKLVELAWDYTGKERIIYISRSGSKKLFFSKSEAEGRPERGGEEKNERGEGERCKKKERRIRRVRTLAFQCAFPAGR
uniref:Uncharacterized protein n=1 Tax=Bracon brevicornis TaxID=1563983 RepID=A0A6V7JRU8_9HYME